MRHRSNSPHHVPQFLSRAERYRRGIVTRHIKKEPKMSQIKKVTDFLKNDIPDINRKADELHQLAAAVKGRAVGIMDYVQGDLTSLDKEIAELQAALGVNTNGGPSLSGDDFPAGLPTGEDK